MKEIKAFFIALFSALFGWLGILAIPVLLMVLCNVIDYGTGLPASKYRNEPISSYKSLRGIIKKVCMWLLVVVGAVVDQLIIYATKNIGIEVKINFIVASIVCVWIICNEIISILENMVDIGLDLPPFLLPLVKNIKKKVENKSEVDIDD